MASGHSRRLGRDKLFVEHRGKTLLETTVERLVKAGLDEIIIVYRDRRALEIAEKYRLLAVYNENSELGQSESIRLGIRSADANADGYMFSVVDQPFMEVQTVEDLLELFEKDGDKIVAPVCKGKRGNPVIFPADLKKELLELEGDTGGKTVIENHLDRVNYLEVEERELFDIDRESDLDALSRRG
jgi:molybdenum cofactor cytidylyltransferase